MNSFLICRFKEKKVWMFLLFAFFFVSSSVCNAAPPCSGYSGDQKRICQIKNSTVVTTSTTDQDSWYDSNDTALHDSVVCDDPLTANHVSYDTYSPINPLYCNDQSGTQHFEHKEYYSSDDLGSDMNINTVAKNFKIRAEASADSGIRDIRIEWKNGGTGTPDSWADARYEICSGGICEICREGGSCMHPSIYVSELSTKSDGSQNVLWFRVIVSTNAGESIVTGEDEDVSMTPVLDKYYRFPICNTSSCCTIDGCGYTCDANIMPAAINLNVTDRCAANLPYILNWTIDDTDGQSRFYLEVLDNDSGNAVYYADVISSSTSFTADPQLLSGGGTLEPNKTYKWRVRVKDDYFDPDHNCKKWSDWSDWNYFTTCSSCGGNTAPVVTTNIVAPPADFCTVVGLPYQFSWNVNDSDGQSKFDIEIWEQGNMAATLRSASFNYSTPTFTANSGVFGAGKDLEYGKTYDWRVKVTDNYADVACRKDSGWVAGPSFTTISDPYPQVDFEYICPGSDCNLMEEIQFNADDPDSTPDNYDYKWFIFDNTTPANWATTTPVMEGKDVVKKFPLSDNTQKEVTLWVINKTDDSACCHKTKSLSLTRTQASWTEVPPNNN